MGACSTVEAEPFDSTMERAKSSFEESDSVAVVTKEVVASSN